MRERAKRARLVIVCVALVFAVQPIARAGRLAPTERVHRTGVAPRTGDLRRTPAPGWLGEHIFGNGNDWEPATAADPTAPYVYLLTTRYSGKGPLPCPYCDLPALALKVSSDGGHTFGAVQYMPVDTPGGQYDPQIATDASGKVYSAWINGNFRDVFSMSTDHGSTWSSPVVISRPAGWADHPWLGVSPSGQHIYVGFNHAASWIAASHDGGSTWNDAVQTSHTYRYFYAGGTVVQDNGNVEISQASYDRSDFSESRVHIVVTRSTDGGQTFQTSTVDSVASQPDCTNRGCPRDHFGGQVSLGSDASGNLVLAYDGAIRRHGAQFIWVRRSSDGGLTWSGRQRMSPKKRLIIASFPAIVGTGDGDFRVAWQDDRNGDRRWNTFVRTSADGGRTWTAGVDISDAGGGRGYKHPLGYDADYGDYMQLAVTDTGKTFATWGEGFSYYGPGGTWFNLQT